MVAVKGSRRPERRTGAVGTAAGNTVECGAQRVGQYCVSSMGQPVTVIEKPSSQSGVIRFEINRTLTGMGHERYLANQTIEGDRPPDELARRLFARGGIEGIHINSNLITVTLERGADTEGLLEIIGSLYTFYGEGVAVPTHADFGYVEEE